MGVKAIGKNFINKHSLVSESITVKELYEQEAHTGMTIYLDLFGAFFSLLPKTRSSDDIAICVGRLVKLIPPSDRLVIVVDGKGSREKQATHSKRQASRDTSLAKFGRLLSELQQQYSDKRVSKSKWKAIQKAKNHSFRLNSSDKARLIEALRSKGYAVVLADGEADVYIAQQNNPLGISNDSDLLFHRNIRVCGRPKLIGNHIVFDMIERPNVLSRLSLSEPQLVSFAIVSGNDYSENIWGYGPAKNLQIIRDIDENLVSDIVSKYRDIARPKEGRPESNFDGALKIFDRLSEDIIDDIGNNNDIWDVMEKEYQEYCDQYQRWKIEKKELAETDFSKLYLKYAQQNPFRPLYELEKPRYRFFEWTDKGVVSNSSAKEVKSGADPTPKPKKKSKKEKAPITPFSKEARKEIIDRPEKPQAEIKKRINGDIGTFMRSISKMKATKTWDIGCLKKRIKSGLSLWAEENYPDASEEDLKSAADKIETNIRDALEHINLLKRLSQVAVSLWINHLLETNADTTLLDNILIGGKPNIPESITDYHDLDTIDEQNDDNDVIAVPFEPIFEPEVSNSNTPGRAAPNSTSQGGTLFWNNLLHYLNKGKSGSKDIGVFGIVQFLQANGIAFEGKKFMPKDLMSMMAQTLDIEFAGLIIGRLEQLKEKVLEFNASLADTIKAIEDESRSRVETFWRINHLLPKPYRYMDSPLSGPSHSFVQITEMALLQILNKIVPKIPIGEHAETKQKRNAIIESENGSPVERILRAYIGSRTDKEMRQATHEAGKGKSILKYFGKDFGRKYMLVGDVPDLSYKGVQRSRYILKSIICTNGLQVYAYAIDTSQPIVKSKSKKSPVKKVTKLKADEQMPDIIVGIDFGKTFTVGACAKGPGLDNGGPEKKRLLSIKKKALNEPGRLYASWLEKKKKETTNIYVTEQEPGNRKPDESMIDYWKRFQIRYQKLSTFYNSKSVQKKSWDRNKAQRCEFDRAVGALLKMVNGKCNQRYIGTNPPMFVLGDATFSATGSLHTTFERYFIRKVSPLGYRIVTVNEYLTSQMCPVTETMTEFVNMRVKTNVNGVYYHRDVMAGENMINAALSIMRTGKRPKYLTKEEEEKKGPPDKRKTPDDDSVGSSGSNKKRVNNCA